MKLGLNSFSADEVINKLDQKDLELIFKYFGDEKNAKKIAKKISQASPRAVFFTKRAINSSYESMGFNQALTNSLNLDVILNAAPDPVKEEFSKIRKEQGLQAAIAWRDKRFK